jgi:hypothetical protein
MTKSNGLSNPPMADKTRREVPESDGGHVANSISSLIQRVRSASVEEIDGLIAELHALRQMLQDDGVRIEREIKQYAHLSQSVVATTKIISEGLAWDSEVNP